jgi:hypothetical protein
MDAIERVYEIAAPYEQATVTINLFIGEHYLVRKSKEYYIPTYIDRKS